MSDVRVSKNNNCCFYVYAVHSEETGLTKVGRTRNLHSRLADLRSEMGSQPLTLLCCVPTFDDELEAQVLLSLTAFRLDERREWFRISERELMSRFAAVIGLRSKPGKIRDRLNVAVSGKWR